MSDQQQPTDDPYRRAKPRLLIADDDPVVQSALSAQLSGEFDIVAARDTDEAIAMAVEHKPDVAIIDVQMPGGGGIRATQEIQLCSPATAVVALSGDESDEVVRDMIAAGAVSYVRKGTAGHVLATTLRRSIDAHTMLVGRAAAQ
jgi:DNA-binding NarL/FixJ family response regulator